MAKEKQRLYVELKCYGKRKWEVITYGDGSRVNTWQFDNPKEAYMFALEQSGLYSEWDV